MLSYRVTGSWSSTACCAVAMPSAGAPLCVVPSHLHQILIAVSGAFGSLRLSFAWLESLLLEIAAEEKLLQTQLISSAHRGQIDFTKRASAFDNKHYGCTEVYG
ncbi:hypothetical protein S245_021452 [Arachis hypogaea]